MHYAVLNRATLRVANTGDISGRLTADSINDDARAQTKSSLWHACGLTMLCSLVSVGVLAALAPAPALAAEGGVPGEIAALKKQVAALQSQVQTLQTQLAAVQSNKALELGPFVSVDPHPENGVIGPNITFKGANIHIVSGSGVTDDHLSTGGSLTGLGNLIIGYDEPLPKSPLYPGQRGGSHNLVIGRWHSFVASSGSGAFGGLVAGEANAIYFEAASVSGGQFNSAYYIASSVSGGQNNSVNGLAASVSGGQFNEADGTFASVSGGQANGAGGQSASVSGGQFNFAGNTAASVSGGEYNSASGPNASVSGGSHNWASTGAASVSGGLNNIASGGISSVCGGGGNTAAGFEAVVIGGSNIIDNNNNSIAPGAPLNYP
jgi:hypothetical protein